ncbi:MAG: hypothetical protein K5753_05225, partial [Clostridia bacterium]|nr:hypothetical protein [Clostridia bacterium]
MIIKQNAFQNAREIKMSLDISDSSFKKVFNDEKLFLPIRWTGGVFYNYLKELFTQYKKNFKVAFAYSIDYADMRKKIGYTCKLLLESVKHYLDGFPSKAYKTFTRVMTILMKDPLRIYYKT